MSEIKAVIEIGRENLSRLSNLMRTLRVSDKGRALNDLFDQIEINEWRRGWRAMDVRERILFLKPHSRIGAF